MKPRRRLVGVYMSPPGSGGMTVSHWHAVYAVVERLPDGSIGERLVNGPPLYEHEHVELTHAFRAARAVLGDIIAACDGLESEREEGGNG